MNISNYEEQHKQNSVYCKWTFHTHTTLESAQEHHGRFHEVTHTVTDIKQDEAGNWCFSSRYWGCD